jgi:hypothetical protein
MTMNENLELSHPETQNALDVARRHRERHLEELKAFLRIPSIGTQPDCKDETIAAADWLAESMQEAGLENVQVIPTKGFPLVYSDWLHAGPDAPTVLIYGHYDVQPVDPLYLWDTPPFEPTHLAHYINVMNTTVYNRAKTGHQVSMYSPHITMALLVKVHTHDQRFTQLM